MGCRSKVSGVSGGPYCYVYDGYGPRVAKKSGANSDCTGGTVAKLYWRALSGDALSETDGSGNTLDEYVFFAGRRVASRDGSGQIFYYFADQLGSTRTISTGSGPGQTPGQLCYDADFTPYGQEMSHSERLQTTACPPSYKFTGYERDSETGLDYAFARYYSPRLGRFLSTDPLGGTIGDLQSHSAYAYTENNPINAVDPSGMACYALERSPSTGCDAFNMGFLMNLYFALGFGSMGGSCQADGVDTPCSIVFGLIGSGAAAVCPNNNCSPGLHLVDGPGGTSVWQQWVPGGLITTIIWRVLRQEPYIAIAIGENLSLISGHWETVGTVPEPQIGMNIFQFGAFTQADRVVKIGTAWTVGGVGTAVAAPSVVAATPYVVSGYEATNTFLIEWAAGDFEGYTATSEMIYNLINSEIMPEGASSSAVFGSLLGCFLWGDEPCPGVLRSH